MTQYPGQIVNGAGFVTTLGGAPLDKEVADALADMSRLCFDVTALAQFAGERIASLLEVPAACVVCGAAAGLMLAVAACLAGDDPARADALPVPAGSARVVTQASLHSSYDRVVRLTGAELVVVGYASRPGHGRTLPWQLEAALELPTAAILHTVAEDADAVPLESVAEIARRRRVPVIVDAAAELPPVTNLRRFLAAGADAVVFSGGKAIRGPQASGLLLGSPTIVTSARRQQEDADVDPVLFADIAGHPPWHHGIGRAMKVGPETVIATLVAVERFLIRDHDAEADEMASWLHGLSDRLGLGVPVAPRTSDGFYPSLIFRLDPDRARAAWRALATRVPSVRLSQLGLSRGVLRLKPEALDDTGRQAVETALFELAPHLQ